MQTQVAELARRAEALESEVLGLKSLAYGDAYDELAEALEQAEDRLSEARLTLYRAKRIAAELSA